jgi:hypothetical protein
MSVCGCGSPASYCQPSAAAGFVYLEFSWIHIPFVFSSIQSYQPFSIAVFFFFNYSLHGEVPLSLCLVELSSWQPLLQAFPSPNCWVGATSPAFSAQLVYLQFAWGIAPYPLSGAWGAQPSLLHVFFFFSCLFIIQFVFFSFFSPWVGGRSIQGAMLIWPRVVCGSTTRCLAHLVVCISWAG